MFQEILLEVENISKSFPGVQALKGIDFSLYSGEVHCIVGENGAGKSTFIKILSGALVPDDGIIKIFGRTYRTLTPSLAIDLGIQTVYQDSVLVGSLSVAENIFLGHELSSRWGFFSQRKTLELAGGIISQFGVAIPPEELVENLSNAEKQIVSILKALSREARVLILDEPTASLSAVEKATLFKVLRQAKDRKVGIIYISHHLEEVFEIGDRVTVLKDGEKVATHRVEEVTQETLVREMVGRPAELFYTRGQLSFQRECEEGEVLEVSDFQGGMIKNVSFRVLSGEIFGIGGMVGSGRTELLRLLFGLDQRVQGKLLLNGHDITPRSPLDAIAKGICLIPEDRQKTGLILARSVRENVTLAAINLVDREWLDLGIERREVESLVRQLQIVTPNIDQEVIYLSGGNQQKVVLAKWLLTRGKIYLFDEPTRGIDVGTKEEIYRLIMDLAKDGKFVIMVSSDLPELIALSDRIGIMRNGEMVAILNREEMSEENILSYALGVKTSYGS